MVECVEVKMSKKYFDYLNNEIDFTGRNFSFDEAKKILLTGRYFAFGDGNNSSTVIACKFKDFFLYDLKSNDFKDPVDFNYWKGYNNWKIMPMPKNKFNNKFVGTNFDVFLYENNIDFKRDINWALKMIAQGKIVTREGNPNLYLFPPDKYDNSKANFTVQDLFAEDWIIEPSRTLKDVLDDFNEGYTIRRKSWHPDKGIGKYSDHSTIDKIDMLAEDWEVVDIVKEVDSVQEQHLKDRNEY